MRASSFLAHCPTEKLSSVITPCRREAGAVSVFGFLALVFPLITGFQCIQANVWKYAGLAAASAAMSALLVWEMRNRPASSGLPNRTRLGLGVTGILCAYAMVLCGVRIETLLILILAPTMVLALKVELESSSISRKWTIGAAVGFAFCVIVSCFLSYNQYTAIVGSQYHRMGLSTFLACVAIFIGALRLVRGREQADGILKLLLGSGFVVSGIALIEFVVPRTFLASFLPLMTRDPRPFGTLGHPNWFGTYLLLLLPFAIVLALNERRRRWWILVALLHSSLMVCQTRGAWVAEAVMLVTVFFVKQYDWRGKLKLLAVLLVVTVTLLPAKNWQILERVATFGEQVEMAAEGEDHAGSDRLRYWKYALRHLPAHLVIGAGLDSFADMADAGEKPPAAKAHSIYFDHALTSGAIGLAFYLAFLWRAFWTQVHTPLKWAFRWMLIAYLVQGIFIHDTIQSWPLLWLLAGLAVGPLAQPARLSFRTVAGDSAPKASTKATLARAKLIETG